MRKLSIGIIREGKVPPDNRTPLTPRQCSELMEEYPDMDIRVQWSPVRCFTDEDYEKFGIPVQESVDDAELLLGIKEVPVDMLVADRTYMFFSHTIKKQPYNRKLLQEVLRKHIRLIDYELLTDEKGIRLIGFGRWAGIVGAHYALLMLGERSGLYELKAARDCVNLQELVDQYDTVQFPKVRIAITGGGRVAVGALEIMRYAGIEEVSIQDYLHGEFDRPVFVQLHSEDLYRHKEGASFSREEFFQHPERFESHFGRFIPRTDILINCMFWDPRAPRLFSEEEARRTDFYMRLISDVSCDIDGSVPITHEATSSDDPVFGYHTGRGTKGKPYQKDTIDVMAVPNLPNELPKDASRDFGLVMKNTVLPLFMKDPEDALFERATIARDGKLTPRYSYLQAYSEGLE